MYINIASYDEKYLHSMILMIIFLNSLAEWFNQFYGKNAFLIFYYKVYLSVVMISSFLCLYLKKFEN